jgi:hypothetical protein
LTDSSQGVCTDELCKDHIIALIEAVHNAQNNIKGDVMTLMADLVSLLLSSSNIVTFLGDAAIALAADINLGIDIDIASGKHWEWLSQLQSELQTVVTVGNAIKGFAWFTWGLSGWANSALLYAGQSAKNLMLSGLSSFAGAIASLIPSSQMITVSDAQLYAEDPNTVYKQCVAYGIDNCMG